MQESTIFNYCFNFLSVPLYQKGEKIIWMLLGLDPRPLALQAVARTIAPWSPELSDAYRKLLLWAFKGFRMNLSLQDWGQVQISNAALESHRALQELEPWFPPVSVLFLCKLNFSFGPLSPGLVPLHPYSPWRPNVCSAERIGHEVMQQKSRQQVNINRSVCESHTECCGKHILIFNR